MPLDSPVADFMAEAPALRLVDEDRPATSETPAPPASSCAITNEDRRRWDAELKSLGWTRTVVRLHDPETGEETGKLVLYAHPDYPNSFLPEGWTQATARLYAGLATGRVKADGVPSA